MLTGVATQEETFTFNRAGCFQNPFGVHRNACCQMLPRKVGESISKCFFSAYTPLDNFYGCNGHLQFLAADFVRLSGVTEFSGPEIMS